MLTGATSFDAAAGEGVAQGTISLQDSWATSTSPPFTTQITSAGCWLLAVPWSDLCMDDMLLLTAGCALVGLVLG
jgi:hypothetical protein